MEAGQPNKLRIGAIIQARIHSTRMPGKVLLPLPFPHGKPILKWIIDGVQNSKFINNLFIATSENPENILIEEFAKKNEIICFRGSEENVLSRFVYLTNQHELDIVVRLTADNPFLDIELLDLLIERHIANCNDYTKSCGLPMGMNFEIISGKKIRELEDKVLSPIDQEHVTYFIANNFEYKKETVNFCETNEITSLRLTVDYPSDFALASVVLSKLDKQQIPNLNFIKETYQNYPWVFDINAGNIQKQEFINPKDEFVFASSILKKMNLNRSAEVLDNTITTLILKNEQ